MLKRGEARVVLRVTRWHETCKRYGLETNVARALALDVDAQTVCRVQNGAAPSLRFMARACALFHCPIDLLFEVVL